MPPSPATASGPVAGTPREPVRLLWTGGWDSTFQLLRLLLVHGREVTPYYLQRARRPSTPVEIATMDRIRAALARQHPQASARLQATRFFDVGTLAQDAAISAAYAGTLRKGFLGRQYEWLAWFCTQQGIDAIELCIHRDDKAHAVLQDCVAERAEGDYRTHVFDPARARRHAPDAAELELLFRHFAFPLFEVTKLEMAHEARTRGWEALMDMTWFCHSPLRNGQPCGCCHPCLYTIEEGLGHRLPRWSRWRSAVFRTCLLPFRGPIVATLQALRLRPRES